MIGIFDSGVGGLSIFSEIKKIMPEISIIYFADQKNFPYGEKKKDDLAEIAVKNVEFLIEKGVSVIIVGCNTATVYIIDDLRKKFNIPFIGVVPAIKPASILSKNNKIGVLATQGTVESCYVDNLAEKLQIKSEIFLDHSSELVELVEKDFNLIDSKILNRAISNFLDNKVDTIVLGCTHYHFLKDKFREILPEITFLDSGEAIAKQAKKILESKNSVKKNRDDQFFTTGDEKIFKEFINNVLNIETDEIYGI